MGKTDPLRVILRSLRQTCSKENKRNPLNHPAYSYVMTEYRRNQATDKQLCRDKEMNHLADTYATYLNSSKNFQTLYGIYHHSELSIEATAKLVGFKLPHDTSE